MIARSGAELLEICRENNSSLAEYAIQYEMESKNCTREDVIKGMEKVLQVMKEAANEGQEKEVYSVSGLIGGDAYKLKKYLEKGDTLTGNVMVGAMARALS
ncbi:L-serine ammonia-lyase, iron-sulfur-dependent, subunit alpha, partial [Bacillus altitudinis]|nr:L-serine ammonia-lyase, iron-sulfur-dependent, subunit alpha [Bacillus altitudinis]